MLTDCYEYDLSMDTWARSSFREEIDFLRNFIPKYREKAFKCENSYRSTSDSLLLNHDVMFSLSMERHSASSALLANSSWMVVGGRGDVEAEETSGEC